MFLTIDYMALVTTFIFVLMFMLSYIVIIKLRIEELFKKGSTKEIIIAQIILSIITAYLSTSGLMMLLGNLQI